MVLRRLGLDETLAHLPRSLDAACHRWRDLFRAASAQAADQTQIAQDPSVGPDQKRRARRLRQQAEAQMDLLAGDAASVRHADFYPYRYLASEGFLPGYSFPRLPLSAFVPGRRGGDEYLSRPRFLAIADSGRARSSTTRAAATRSSGSSSRWATSTTRASCRSRP